MPDDPWEKQDPYQPPAGWIPPPQYGGTPPPGYAPGYGPPPPYGPLPGYSGNPYQGPLPKRGGYKKLFLWLGILSLLVLGGCGVGVYYLVNTLSKNADAANAFLRDVRDQRFDDAFNRLCPAEQSQEGRDPFTSALRQANTGRHGVTKFDITSSETNSTNGSTTRTAGGTVTFADGQTRELTFDIGKSGSTLCISGGYRQLD